MIHKPIVIRDIIKPVNDRKQDFIEWLVAEIEGRGWSFRDFAQRAGSSIATVSRVMNRHQQPTESFCKRAAQALNMRPEHVMRRAGVLPPEPPKTERTNELLHYWHQLTTGEQYTIITQVRALAEQQAEYHAKETEETTGKA